MNMIVCVKQVIDPEAPPASFKVDSAAKKVVPPQGVPPVLSPFDENAVEAALKIKDAQGGKIAAISMGNNLLREVVKKPLSMGADELILLEHEAFTDLLRAVFHLTEELAFRKDVKTIPPSDRKHLAGDIKRGYVLLVHQWLAYMEYLKKHYPYLFSLALRTNPFDQNASPIVKETP